MNNYVPSVDPKRLDYWYANLTRYIRARMKNKVTSSSSFISEDMFHRAHVKEANIDINFIGVTSIFCCFTYIILHKILLF